MAYLRDCRRIVVKVGTSTLTHATGHLNLRRIQSLVKVISDMKNSGLDEEYTKGWEKGWGAQGI